MADTVRGLTIEIAADPSKFNSAIKELKSESKTAQTELSALHKSLKFDFNEKDLKRAQQVAQEALDKTAERADLTRARLAELEKSGAVDTTEYRELEKELAVAESQAAQLKKTLNDLNNAKLDNLSKQITKVGDNLQQVGSSLKVVSGAAVGAIAGLGALGLKAVSTADEVATLATQYDVTAAAIQKFNYVALQTDVDADNLYKAMVKVRSGVADISSGATSAASTALQKLNLDLNSFDGSEQQFYAIIAALSEMEDKTEMVAIANDVFGDKLANNLLPMIYAGTDAIQGYCDEYEELGALSDEQVARLAEFDNVLNKLKTQFANVAAQIGASLLPIMQKLADFISENIIPKLQRLSEWFNGLSLDQQEFALKALTVIATLAPLAMGIGKVVSAVGNVIKILPQLGAALSALEAHPIILIIAAIAAVLLILYTQCEQFRDSINNLVKQLTESLSPILEIITGVFQKIIEKITPIITLIGEQLGNAINILTDALNPLFDIISVIFDILGPLLENALDPLLVCLDALSVPLQLIGTLLNWLSPLFKVFGVIVSGVMKAVMFVVNLVIGWVEDAINFVIGILNALIDGVNASLGWLGVSIDHVADVKLRLDTADIDDLDDVDAVVNKTTVENESPGASGSIYDNIGAQSTAGDIYNYDYSKTEKTQNVTVVIENYAQNVDVDDLVRQINIKLAEAM